MESGELDIVEGSGGSVGAPATRDNFTPLLKRKSLDDGNAPGLTETL
jgi:hypothetical protein